jgi:hypothetical protein
MTSLTVNTISSRILSIGTVTTDTSLVDLKVIPVVVEGHIVALVASRHIMASAPSGAIRRRNWKYVSGVHNMI